MIEMKIQHNLGSFDPVKWPEMMSRVSMLMYNSVIKNFAEGGRPTKWPKKKTPVGGEIPSYRGKTIQKVKHSSGDTWAKAGIDNPSIADYANEFGAKPRPKVTEASKSFFWRMYFLTGNEMWKYMALMKVGKTLKPTIPARRAFIFQEDDKRAIKEMLRSVIYKTFTPQRRKQ
jgi:phage gpG-like protein